MLMNKARKTDIGILKSDIAENIKIPNNTTTKPMKPFESRDLKDLHPILADAYLKAEAVFNAQNGDVNVIRTCTFRNNAMQQVYFNKRPKITNARPGESPHNYNPSFAFDIAFVRNRQLDWSPKYFKAFAEIIKGINSDIVWGGDWVRFKDAPHFELKNWRAKI